jgi:hypothetical protein
MKNHLLVILQFVFLSLISCSPPSKTVSYLAKDSQLLNDGSLKVLYIPLQEISSKYNDNTGMKPQVELSDSFYVEAANSLIMFGLSNRYRFIVPQPQQSDSLHNFNVLFRQKWSKVNGDTCSPDSFSARIRDIAALCKADLIFVPYSCHINQSASRQNGWRSYSGSYEKPLIYSADAKFHLQVWDKTGNLVFERIGTGNTGRPIFYTLVKHQQPGDNIISYSRKIFAPPLVKALDRSIKNAFYQGNPQTNGQWTSKNHPSAVKTH